VNRQALQRLVELGIAVALVVVLSNVRIYKLPQGGSITAGSMVPIFYIALRWGAKWGITAGIVAGIVNYIFDPFFTHPIQVLLDYPVAFGVLGLAGLFPGRPVLGIIIGGAGRWLAHFVSGIVFFAQFAPKGVSPVLYSALYNGSYMLPEVVISAVLTLLVLRAMQRIRPVQPA
jgi:thiamine transporter